MVWVFLIDWWLKISVVLLHHVLLSPYWDLVGVRPRGLGTKGLGFVSRALLYVKHCLFKICYNNRQYFMSQKKLFALFLLDYPYPRPHKKRSSEMIWRLGLAVFGLFYSLLDIFFGTRVVFWNKLIKHKLKRKNLVTARSFRRLTKEKSERNRSHKKKIIQSVQTY